MSKQYVTRVPYKWCDDVGSAVVSTANKGVDMLNEAASDFYEVIGRVDKARKNELEYTSRAEDLMELKTRLEQSLEAYS